MAPKSERTREFVGLIVRHQTRLRAYIISLMPGLPGVSDVLQETNLVLWEKMKSFKSGTNFTAWAFKVARLEVLAHCRKLKRADETMANPAVAERIAEQIGSDFEGDNDLIETRIQALHHCMEKLSDEERALVMRRYTSGTSLAEYARETGYSSSSLRSVLQRLRIALRRCITARLATEPYTG